MCVYVYVHVRACVPVCMFACARVYVHIIKTVSIPENQPGRHPNDAHGLFIVGSPQLLHYTYDHSMGGSHTCYCKSGQSPMTPQENL